MNICYIDEEIVERLGKIKSFLDHTTSLRLHFDFYYNYNDYFFDYQHDYFRIINKKTSVVIFVLEKNPIKYSDVKMQLTPNFFYYRPEAILHIDGIDGNVNIDDLTEEEYFNISVLNSTFLTFEELKQISVLTKNIDYSIMYSIDKTEIFDMLDIISSNLEGIKF